MRTVNHQTARFTGIAIIAAAAALLVLVSCGARVVRGESPFVRINSLKLDERTVTLDLGIRNINDVLMEIEHIDFLLSVRGTELAGFNAARKASVIATGSETLSFDVPVSEAGYHLLTALQSGDIDNLPYAIEGSIKAVDDNQLKFKGDGHLYPVPGRPGQFR